MERISSGAGGKETLVVWLRAIAALILGTVHCPVIHTVTLQRKTDLPYVPLTRSNYGRIAEQRYILYIQHSQYLTHLHKEVSGGYPRVDLLLADV